MKVRRVTMAPKPTLGRTVAIGAVLGLAGCAVLLGSNDGAMRRSLAATPSTPKSVRQETKADRSLRYNMNDDKYTQDTFRRLIDQYVISGQDEGAEVWLINQPKCGTGMLLISLVTSLYCDREEENWNATLGDYAAIKEYVDSDQLSALDILPDNNQFCTYDCANHNHLTFTHTPKNAMALRMEYQSRKAEQDQDAGKGVVVSAVRDPHGSIPSLWFWMNRERCEFFSGWERVIGFFYCVVYIILTCIAFCIICFVIHQCAKVSKQKKKSSMNIKRGSERESGI